ncbi:uncharacterized protein BP5553_04840 [Venustampulla echinocandica]|uniref:F-box domain-containing protein n=1 Tax=Venustampulla echinocandica TaxID=2656787 RepID=A0A370TPF8_9HELO|nr:uncharacterized protein BP5553_04840 [Venustampulla echinocandica]RDL37407.1 hypothetical protein BP5553_04840 [Venustampulla echinocandica]
MASASPLVRAPGQQAGDETIHQPLTSQSPLTSLSDEILIAIAEYVGCDTGGVEPRYQTKGIAPQGPKNVYNLSLCSRRLRHITLPLVYSHIRSDNVCYDGITEPLVSFLCKILAAPEIAGWVQVFHGAVMEEADGLLNLSQVTDEDWARIRSAVDAASESGSQGQGWLRGIESGLWDAIVTLVLSRLPNLEELEFENWTCGFDYFPILARYVARAAELQQCGETSTESMLKLRRVALYFWDTEFGILLLDLVGFLKLKSLESFYAHMVHEDNYSALSHDGPPPEWYSPELEFSTKSLHLHHCNIDHKTLTLFLRCFTSLERLRYKNGVVSYCEFEPSRMMEALEHMKPCVKELVIIDHEDTYFGEYQEEYQKEHPLSSLVGFEKLKSIEMDACITMGHRTSADEDEAEGKFPKYQNLKGSLPPNLESLRLHHCGSKFLTQICEYIVQKDTCTPALKRLDLGWEKVQYPEKYSPDGLIHPNFTNEEANKLLAACQEADVEMVMKTQRPKGKFASYKDKKLGIVSNYFHYPYNGYEEFCKEHGCDLETGRSYDY